MAKSIEENLVQINARVKRAAYRAGRDYREVKLLAATKNRGVREIREAVAAGVGLVGENRVQEFLAKYDDIGDSVEWHFIGHLQRNKVRHVVGKASLIHSVDSERLAREIDERARSGAMTQAVLLQVNIGGEESKFGLEPGMVEELMGALADCRNIDIRGLSTVAPLVDEPEDVRWVFRRLREMGSKLEEAGFYSAGELSMGMTNDFEVAIEEGATIIRIGTAIFNGV